MSNHTSVTATISKGEHLSVSKIYKETVPFAKYGTKQTIKGSRMSNASEHVDILEVIDNITNNGSFVLRILRDSIYISDHSAHDTNPLIKINRTSLSSSDKYKWDKGISNLLSSELVRKSKRGSYMINPFFMIPNNFEEHKEVWNTLND